MHSLWLDTHPVPAGGTEQFVSGTDYDTVVAGAGLTGLTTAVLLARAGQRVAVLEARSVGAAATGNTTAKLSLLQGTTLSQISRHQSDQVLRAYVEGNREGQSWLLRYLEERGVPFQRRRACTYATSPQGAEALRREQRAAETAGLSVTWTDETELPFPVTGSIVLEDQAQIHPMEVLDALATELREHGGTLIQGVRVTGAGIGSPLTVKTTHGEVQADHLVLATGAPVLDRGGYFAKLLPQRSYAQAYRIPESPGSLPQGMYLSADAPSRSLRPSATRSCCWWAAMATWSADRNLRRPQWTTSRPGPRSTSPEPSAPTRGPPRTTAQPTSFPSLGRCPAEVVGSTWPPATTSGA